MKLGVFTVVLGDLSLDEACGFLAENGVQMVEIGVRRISWKSTLRCSRTSGR